MKAESISPAGVVAGSSPVVLYVPKRLLALASAARQSYSEPVEIQTYQSLPKGLAKRMASEKMIVVADLDAFSKFEAQHKLFANGAANPGKALLLTEREDFEEFPFLTTHGVEVINTETTPSLLGLRVNKLLEEFRFDREITFLREEDLKKRRDLDSLNEIGTALSTEKDLDNLLDLIVSKSREMTWADGGSLYLVEADANVPEVEGDYFKNKKMRFQVAQNDSRNIPFKSFQLDIAKSSIYGYVALTQDPLNIEDVYYLDPKLEYGWAGRDFDKSINYRSMSILAVPMVNWRGESIGVIQLLNRKVDPAVTLDDPETCVQFIQPFTEHDIAMAMSIASQASIAIQNTQLVSSIKGLFDGFIAASVKAIESRDPTTSGHSQRVADLTVELARHVDKSDIRLFKDMRFSEEMVQEVRYASLLHDFGKIGVRENVLVKAKKLFPYELQGVQDRFNLIRRTIQFDSAAQQVEYLAQDVPLEERKAFLEKTSEERQVALEEVEEFFQFVLQCNEPTVLAQGGFERLNDIGKRLFKNWEGEEAPFLNAKEVVSLSVPRGSLNENDRKEIESHVTHTYKFLTTIPWTPDLRHVPEIAYAHHEKLDGTGYPNKLTADTIPIQAKMMSISDIFDALTASDRPYKKAMPAERALNILKEEANTKHVDGDLLDLFIGAEIYKIVAT